MKRAALGAIGKNDSAAGDRAGLIAAFDRFLDTMWIAFQPIVDARTRKTFGYEALLRSNEAALPHPGAVLAAAERLDRLPELGRRIRDLAAVAFEHAPPDALMFVNLHTRDLLDPLLTSESAPLSRVARWRSPSAAPSATSRTSALASARCATSATASPSTTSAPGTPA
jgi:EAL domain-containing protein (putative c-di-GMP-specific phosphodiesterase class I)